MEINEELARRCLRGLRRSTLINYLPDRAIFGVLGTIGISIEEFGRLRSLMRKELEAAIENHCTMEAKIIPSQVEKT